jgi:hypothetical protein
MRVAHTRSYLRSRRPDLVCRQCSKGGWVSESDERGKPAEGSAERKRERVPVASREAVLVGLDATLTYAQFVVLIHASQLIVEAKRKRLPSRPVIQIVRPTQAFGWRGAPQLQRSTSSSKRHCEMTLRIDDPDRVERVLEIATNLQTVSDNLTGG